MQLSIYDDVSDLEFTPTSLSTEDATSLRHRLHSEAPETIVEICQVSSQLTLYLAAFLEDQGKGTLTTFHGNTGSSSDQIKNHLTQLGLLGRISSLQSGRSYTWAIKRLLAAEERLEFDVCIVNGNKTWDASGFGAVLADMLLRPGGLMVLTDINWSMASSPYFKSRPHLTQKYAPDEQRARPVQLVMDLILPHLGYEVIDAPECKSFGLARKL
jgi:predicted O-methyltransferase YrrM